MSTFKHIQSNWQRILPILVFAFGFWYFCLRILGIGLEYIPGDLGDARFINYLFEHGYSWLSGQTDSFWNAPYMYPHMNTIAISDNVLGTMPFYAFWRMLGMDQESAYQFWWLSICALNFWITYIVLKRWFNRWDLALIGAWIFAFTIFNTGQLNYMQMIIRFMVPVVFFAAYKLVVDPKIKYLALFSFGLVYQFYCVIYIGFFLLYFSFGFLILFALIERKPLFFLPLLKGKNLFYSLLIGLLSIAAMLWLMLPYIEVSRQMGTRTYEEVRSFIPLIESFLYPQHATFMYKYFVEWFQPNVADWWIHHTFPGLVPLTGLVAAPFILLAHLFKKINLSKVSIALFMTAFLIGLFYIRTESGTSLYYFVHKLPGMNSIRVINRFMHVELFILIVALIALAKPIRKSFSILLFVLVFFDNSFVPARVIRSEKAAITQRRIATVNEINNLKSDKHIAFAIIDPNNAFFINQIDGMIATNYVGLPTINGYSSSCPGEFGEFFGNNNREGLMRWLNYNQIDSSSVLIIERPLEVN